jgi:hypothetical protein
VPTAAKSHKAFQTDAHLVTVVLPADGGAVHARADLGTSC